MYSKLQKITFFSFCLFLSVQGLFSSSDSCKELKDLIHKSYSETILYITNHIETLKEKQQSCIDILVKNGKLEELDYYLNELAKKGVDYRENLSVSINTMKKALDEINNKHRFEKKQYQTVYPAFRWAQSLEDIFIEIKFAHRFEVKEYQTISPAFKWAQSLEDVFIEIKYAHRHDSPGCLEIKDMNIDIKNDSVSFEGFCVLGDVPIKIDFKIDTFKGLNVSDCSHGAGSVGRYQLTLKKGEKSYWKKLLKEDSPIPLNMKVWFEMKEKYHEELKEFEEKEEKENDNIDKLLDKIEKKKKKGGKKKKDKGKANTNETVSDTNNNNHHNDKKHTNKTTDL